MGSHVHSTLLNTKRILQIGLWILETCGNIHNKKIRAYWEPPPLKSINKKSYNRIDIQWSCAKDYMEHSCWKNSIGLSDPWTPCLSVAIATTIWFFFLVLLLLHYSPLVSGQGLCLQLGTVLKDDQSVRLAGCPECFGVTPLITFLELS